MQQTELSNQNTIAYFAKFGKEFFYALAWLLVSSLNLAKYYNTRNHVDYFWLFAFVFFWTILLPRVSSILYFKLSRKPIFTANSLFIHDHYEGIKYYWADIEEIILEDNDDLTFKMYEPAKYIKEFKRPFSRIRALIRYYVLRTKPQYVINMDSILIKRGGNKLFIDALRSLDIGFENQRAI